jgi:hypothetical protein
MAICIMTYICLYRKSSEALTFVVLGSYALGLLSSMLQSVSVFGGVTLFILNSAIKKQLYNSGPVQFAWTALSNVLLYHISTWLISSLFEGQSPQFRPLDWILELLFTALIVRMLYAFFVFIDHRTKRIEMSELDR